MGASPASYEARASVRPTGSRSTAVGYQITGLESQLAELRAEQQQLILQIGEARSPAVITRRATSYLHLVELPPQSVTFAPRSTKPSR